jgi:hypothetical protein
MYPPSGSAGRKGAAVGQRHRNGDRRPGVPVRCRRKADLCAHAVDDQALSARLRVAVTTGAVGVADDHIGGAGRGAEYLPGGVSPGRAQPGDEPGRAEVVEVVAGYRRPAAQAGRAGLAGLAERALPAPGRGDGRGGSRGQRAEQLHLGVDGGERAGAYLVGERHLAGGDRQLAVRDAAGVRRDGEVAIHDVEGRLVEEAAGRRVFHPDHLGGEYLEASVAFDDGGRRLGLAVRHVDRVGQVHRGRVRGGRLSGGGNGGDEQCRGGD